MNGLVVSSREWSSRSNKHTGTDRCGHFMSCLVFRIRAWSSESNKHTGTDACGHNIRCLVVRSRQNLFSKQKKLLFDRSVRQSLT
jgi:hypothetical protein